MLRSMGSIGSHFKVEKLRILDRFGLPTIDRYYSARLTHEQGKAQLQAMLTEGEITVLRTCGRERRVFATPGDDVDVVLAQFGVPWRRDVLLFNVLNGPKYVGRLGFDGATDVLEVYCSRPGALAGPLNRCVPAQDQNYGYATRGAGFWRVRVGAHADAIGEIARLLRPHEATLRDVARFVAPGNPLLTGRCFEFTFEKRRLVFDDVD